MLWDEAAVVEAALEAAPDDSGIVVDTAVVVGATTEADGADDETEDMAVVEAEASCRRTCSEPTTDAARVAIAASTEATLMLALDADADTQKESVKIPA